MPTTVDDRGRVLIPKELRDRLGLEPGDSVLIDADEEALYLRPALSREEALGRLIGGVTEENAKEDEGELDPLDVKEVWEPDP